MKILLLTILAISIMIWPLRAGSTSSGSPESRTPILVELFTSEGCSSCPPADRFLQQLDQQPIAGAEIIVLSEHVDYWNHIGWRDPYSDHFYSERQDEYGRHFGLDSVYTPQMVVDGSSEFVGSNVRRAQSALEKAAGRPKIAVHLSSLVTDSRAIHVHVETGRLEPSFSASAADVFVALALNHAESQVSSGENAGHRLTHTAVVRSLTKIGSLKAGQILAKDVDLGFEPRTGAHNLRVVAFVQEPRQGRVLGAAWQRASAQ
jgi:hypothetical protein